MIYRTQTCTRFSIHNDIYAHVLQNSEKQVGPNDSMISDLVLWSVFSAQYRKTCTLQEGPHGLQLDLGVSSLSTHLFQGTGIGLQSVQGANGIL